MVKMNDNTRDFRTKTSESEKITINLGLVDLGQIDLLVSEGFYSNRTDLIRTAIRNQLDRHNEALKQTILRKKLELGIHRYSKFDLEKLLNAQEMIHIQVLGLAIIEQDVTPELALKTIATIHVLGAFQASHVIKAALSERMR
jgi:Arc/MetJ-type ribon-helix-helix transcriptional regulator